MPTYYSGNPLDQPGEHAVCLQLVQDKVFTVSCTFSACHNTASNQGGLILDPGKSYANLVNVKSVGAPRPLTRPSNGMAGRSATKPLRSAVFGSFRAVLSPP